MKTLKRFWIFCLAPVALVVGPRLPTVAIVGLIMGLMVILAWGMTN